VAGSCEYGDEPSGCGATELVLPKGGRHIRDLLLYLAPGNNKAICINSLYFKNNLLSQQINGKYFSTF
jgi:hypothetical protein